MRLLIEDEYLLTCYLRLTQKKIIEHVKIHPKRKENERRRKKLIQIIHSISHVYYSLNDNYHVEFFAYNILIFILFFFFYISIRGQKRYK